MLPGLNGDAYKTVLDNWAGDEFLAILVNVQEAALASVANKLRLLVEQSSLQRSADGHHWRNHAQANRTD